MAHGVAGESEQDGDADQSGGVVQGHHSFHAVLVVLVSVCWRVVDTVRSAGVCVMPMCNVSKSL